MGYFKERRKRKEAKEREIMIDLFTAQTMGTQAAVRGGVLDAINIFDAKKYEYEDNVRENLAELITNATLSEKLVQEIANVIDLGSQLYGYRIAKGKREELAEDILVSLSVKK